MAVIFSMPITHDRNGEVCLNYSIPDKVVSKAVIEAAELIKKILQEEAPEACTAEACKYIIKKTTDYFDSQLLK